MRECHRARPLSVSVLLFMLILASIQFAATLPAMAASCESLSTLKLPDTTITSAQSVGLGEFQAPPSIEGFAVPKDIPAFCRVAMEVKPASDSDIKMEVWLPATGWNGKFQGVGNGGFAGNITFPGLGNAVKAGYAAASTDTGHTGALTDAKWALGHPDKIVDFGYRAIH